MPRRDVSFLAFYLAWAAAKGWTVPDCHIVAAHWLEHRGPDAVFMAFRGFSKSTILAVYNAWRFWRDPSYRILHQGDQDGTAYKTSRDTKAVLLRHPWTRIHPRDITGEIAFWRVAGNDDERNPSMQAAGIMSNVTSSRADECQNDDVEVPRNIGTPEAREKLRYRLGEQTHILVPGGRKLYIGTPHTHDSLYEEQIAAGADVLKIPLFANEHRVENPQGKRLAVSFHPEFVFVGIGPQTKLLRAGIDYGYDGTAIVLEQLAGGLIDCYAGCAWPERFNRAELLKRRKECRTLNEWDSQYQLHSKPIGTVRLDPNKLIPYDVEPTIRSANGEVAMWLGKVQIMSATLRLDPSAGKINSDVSALCLVLQDALGNVYWHRALGMVGELAEFNEKGEVIGGQVMQVCDVVKEFQIPCVNVETNGIGGHVPSILRGALRARKLSASVYERQSTKAKNPSILAAFEPNMQSGALWAHVSVIERVRTQMLQWNPQVSNQPDDYLDAAAKAIDDEPVRIGRVVAAGNLDPMRGWRPTQGEYTVTVEY
jgi:hypothetical protein